MWTSGASWTPRTAAYRLSFSPATPIPKAPTSQHTRARRQTLRQSGLAPAVAVQAALSAIVCASGMRSGWTSLDKAPAYEHCHVPLPPRDCDKTPWACPLYMSDTSRVTEPDIRTAAAYGADSPNCPNIIDTGRHAKGHHGMFTNMYSAGSFRKRCVAEGCDPIG